jgi:phage terminase small subunit
MVSPLLVSKEVIVGNATGKRKGNKGRMEAGIDKNGDPINPGLKAMHAMERGMTERQIAWVHAYLGPARFNGTKAAKMAGYGGDHATLAAMSSELKRHPKVKAMLKEYADRVLEEAGYNERAMIRELTDLAFSDIGDFVKVEGGKEIIEFDKRKNTHTISEITTQNISTGDELIDARVTKLKMRPKKWAMEALLRLKGMDEGQKGDTVVNVTIGGKKIEGVKEDGD